MEFDLCINSCMSAMSCLYVTAPICCGFSLLVGDRFEEGPVAYGLGLAYLSYGSVHVGLSSVNNTDGCRTLN